MTRGVPFAVLLLLATGCGGGKSVVAVEGTVMLDGKPLAGALVSFQPTGSGRIDEDVGYSSVGTTDQAGRYTLQYADPKGIRTGAIVGSHRVTITAGGDGMVPAIVPDRYNLDTKLTFEVVSGGTKDANFDLTSAP